MKAVATYPYRTIDNSTSITHKPKKAIVTMRQVPLLLILAFQALYSLIFLRNTAFQDEALYIYAGRQIVQHWLGMPAVLENYSFYFSGNPYIYPVIVGPLDMLGGLELVRAFSLLCMVIVTTCGYYVTRQMFNQKSAIFAAIFFVCQGPVLFLTRLATYDPLCLCLLALATALAVRVSHTKRYWQVLGIGPLLVLAFGAKYAALLFIPPVLMLLVLYAAIRCGWRGMFIQAMLAGVSMAVAAMIAVYIILHFDRDMLHALSDTTTNRIVIAGASRVALAEHVLQMVGVCYFLAGVALFFVRKKELLLALLLLGASLLVPAYHIYKAEWISLDKHLSFSMFFLMPVAGYALARLAGFRVGVLVPERYLMLSSLSICLLLFLFVTPEAQVMYTTWPSTSTLADVLKTQVRYNNGHYLVEQLEASRYNLEQEASNWQWVGLDFFQYTDQQGHFYIGDQAYVKAIDDGYFNLVQLNYADNHHTTDILITQAIARNHTYKLIAKIPSPTVYTSGYYWIWSKR